MFGFYLYFFLFSIFLLSGEYTAQFIRVSPKCARCCVCSKHKCIHRELWTLFYNTTRARLLHVWIITNWQWGFYLPSMPKGNRIYLETRPLHTGQSLRNKMHRWCTRGTQRWWLWLESIYKKIITFFTSLVFVELFHCTLLK